MRLQKLARAKIQTRNKERKWERKDKRLLWCVWNKVWSAVYIGFLGPWSFNGHREFEILFCACLVAAIRFGRTQRWGRASKKCLQKLSNNSSIVGRGKLSFTMSYPNFVWGLLLDDMQPLIGRFKILGTLLCTICKSRDAPEIKRKQGYAIRGIP